MAKEAESAYSFHDWLSSLSARGAIGFLFFFAFLCGVWISATGLHDPDTCWLLAIGKYIVDSGQIPHIDPFSYTMGDRPFVPYQWLSEVIFFCAYKIAAGYGLLSLVMGVLITAFLSMPIVYHKKLKAPMLTSLFVVVLGTVAASFHSLARPEVFSYLLLSALFWIMAKIRLRAECRRTVLRKDVPSLLPIFVLFILWANMHTGFISGIVVLLCYALGLTVEFIVRKVRFGTIWREKNLKSAVQIAWLMVLVAVAGTLLNPFGFNLWCYIPQLFFSPINKYISELHSITLRSLALPTYYPYFFLFLLWTWHFFKRIRDFRKESERSTPFGMFYSLLLALVVLILGIRHVRIIPFSALFYVYDIAWMQKGKNRPGTGRGASPVAKTSSGLSSMIGPVATPVLLFVFGILGVLLTFTRLPIPPTVPQEGVAFQAPRGGISYLAEKLPQGRVLNDPQYGDMMIWHLCVQEKPFLLKDPFRVTRTAPAPKVFIDTRFDMYGPELVGDYHSITNLKPGWKDVFERYHFDWVFLPKKFRLIDILKSDMKWHELYSDGDSVILAR